VPCFDIGFLWGFGQPYRFDIGRLDVNVKQSIHEMSQPVTASGPRLVTFNLLLKLESI